MIVKKYIAWFTIVIFFAFQFVLRLAVGILQDEIIDKFQIDIISFGTLAGVYYLGYAGFQLPMGILLDRFNVKVVVILSFLTMTFGTMTFISHSWNTVIIGRFLIGVGSTAGFLGVVRVSQICFPQSAMKMVGVGFGIGLSGAVFAGKPMSIIFRDIGYYNTFTYLSYIPLILAVIMFFSMPNGYSVINKNSEKKEEIEFSLYEALKCIFSPKILSMSFCGGLLVGSFEGFGDVWAIAFFRQIFQFSHQDSIVTANLIFVAMIFGAPFWGFVSKHIDHKKILFYIAILNSLMFGILFYFTQMNYALVVIIMLFIGVLAGYQVIILDWGSTMVPSKYFTMISAAINSINLVFGYIFHTVIARAIVYFSDSMHVHHYSYETLVKSLSVVPIAGLIGGVGFLLISSTKSEEIPERS
jgi:predicted MFS family arabinose efflux permease